MGVLVIKYELNELPMKVGGKAFGQRTALVQIWTLW